MPGFNRTGPMGMGPMTGGRRGLCTGGMPGGGRGAGFGRMGMGFGRNTAPGYPYATPAADRSTEMDMLKARAREMTAQLENIKRRIEDLSETEADNQ